MRTSRNSKYGTVTARVARRCGGVLDAGEADVEVPARRRLVQGLERDLDEERASARASSRRASRSRRRSRAASTGSAGSASTKGAPPSASPPQRRTGFPGPAARAAPASSRIPSVTAPINSRSPSTKKGRAKYGLRLGHGRKGKPSYSRTAIPSIIRKPEYFFGSRFRKEFHAYVSHSAKPPGSRWVRPRCRQSPDRIGARPGRGPEHQHGVGDDVARRRPVPPATERAVARRVDEEPASPPGWRQRLPDRRHPVRRRASGRNERRRRLARPLQVARRRPHVEEHPPPRLPAGRLARGPRVAPQGPRRRRGRDRARGRRRRFPVQRHRVQPGDQRPRRPLRRALHRQQRQGERRRDPEPRPDQVRRDRRRGHRKLGPVPRQAHAHLRRPAPGRRALHVHDAEGRRRYADADGPGRPGVPRLHDVRRRNEQHQHEGPRRLLDGLRRDVGPARQGELGQPHQPGRGARDRPRHRRPDPRVAPFRGRQRPERDRGLPLDGRRKDVDGPERSSPSFPRTTRPPRRRRRSSTRERRRARCGQTPTPRSPRTARAASTSRGPSAASDSGGDARVVLSTSTNGTSWSTPQPVDNGPVVDDEGEHLHEPLTAAATSSCRR